VKHSLLTGFSFGLTSGITTTLGLMVGLYSGTNSKLAVIGGVIMIAIADSLADAMGIHISEEAENKHTEKEIWVATLATFISKFIFALSFIVPLLLFKLSSAIVVSIIWGLSLLSIFSYFIAKEQKINPWKTVIEHLIIALVVIVVTHYVGDFIASYFD
jgi:VIT1/CCC1 family predicted Fe2+/Mn2+ transporter